MWHPLAPLKSLWRAVRSRPKQPASRRLVLHCEPLEDRVVPAVSAQEQLFVYLLNRARHDPAAYGQEQNLSVNLAGIAPQAPLAINDMLFDSTQFHAADMATRFYFSHNTPEGLTPNEMIRNEDYVLNSIFAARGNNVESIAAGTYIDTAAEALNLLIEDEGVSPPGHRIHLLAMSSFWQAHREIGVGHVYNGSDPTWYRNYWAIHTAYTNSSDKFLTGVVFNDANTNGRYDLNEGLAGVTVSIGAVSVTTNAAGGWAIPVSGTPTVTVTASGGAFTGASTATVAVGSNNIEIDFISGRSSGIVNFEEDFVSVQNHAPVLDPSAAPTLRTINEDATSLPVTVASLLGTAVSDADAGDLRGMAITSVAGGTWQYSINGGRTYLPITGVSDLAALLLRDTDRIRFVASNNYNGAATLTFHAWDRTEGSHGTLFDLTTGTGDATAFSVDSATASITVNALNDAPVLAAGTPMLPRVAVNDANPTGITVGELVGNLISDVDGAGTGIAVFGLWGGGVWQYSTDGGATYQNFGRVNAAVARLLDASHLVRFVPKANYTLTLATRPLPFITYRAWDQTVGSAGQTGRINGIGRTAAFSTAWQRAKVVVNSAPVLTPASRTLGSIASTSSFTTTVAALLGSSVQDSGLGTMRGIAVTGVTSTTGGRWLYSTNGRTYFELNPSSSAAVLLRATDRLRYVPSAGNPGTATITFHAWDMTAGLAGQRMDLTLAEAVGGESSVSAETDAASLIVA